MDYKLDFSEKSYWVCSRVNSGIFLLRRHLSMVVETCFLLLLWVFFIIILYPFLSYYVSILVAGSSKIIRLFRLQSGLPEIYLIITVLRPVGLLTEIITLNSPSIYILVSDTLVK